MTLPRLLRNLLAMVAYGFAHPLPQPGRHPAAITYLENSARTEDESARAHNPRRTP